MKGRFSKFSHTLKDKPRFSILLLTIFLVIFAITGIYIVYNLFAATTVTKSFAISPAGGGTVKNVLPDGRTGTSVNCPTDCQGSYPYSTTANVTFKAYPNTNYKFYRWKNGATTSTSNPISIQRTSNQTWTAEFMPVAGTTADLEYANSLVTRYATACPLLSGVLVEYGDTRGYQALSFVGSGKILLSKTHTTTTDRLIYHEIYHHYDYRDNNVLNWGETIPPATRPACMPVSAIY